VSSGFRWGALAAALVAVAVVRPVPPLLTAVCGGACMAAAVRLLAVCVVGRERIRAAQADE
jgi:ABC-type enterobactin transport system permease subunit